MKKIAILILLSMMFIATVRGENQTPIYLDTNAPIEERVEDALKRLTTAEKVALCHAQSKFSSKGVARLGIPELWMSDGPHGIRAEIEWDSWNYAGFGNDSCTAFPALTALAATWNPKMSAIYGQAIGAEARYRKKDVLLGPGCNIYRTPLNGRNFEYLGEDPHLASVMIAPYIQQVQQNGVATCVKHFILNNQEVQRMDINVKVSERALREIYLPAFKAAVDAGAWSFMGSYNKYLGQWCCHNEVLVNKILKGEWGFDGAYISDWSGCHDTKQAADYGLDIEMGTGSDGLTYSIKNAYDNYYLAMPYLEALNKGEVSMSDLDEKARRILRLMFRTTMSANRPCGSFATEQHAEVNRTVAQEAITLLKNDGILPLRPSGNLRIAVIGDNATRSMCKSGGSSELKPWREVSPLEAVKNIYGEQNVIYAMGYDGGDAAYGRVIEPTTDAQTLRREAIECAKNADVVLFFGGLNKNHQQDCEDGDRIIYGLPYGQEELIKEIAGVNPNIVVTLISGNAVETSWDSSVRGLVQGWYLGTEAGSALLDIISGKVNPSGKLPISFYAQLQDCGAHSFGVDAYPGNGVDVTYMEDVLVGYRWLNAKQIKAKYPFGYGLSYTTFTLGKPSVQKQTYSIDEVIRVKVRLSNSGAISGQEVVQLYVGKDKSQLVRAPKELKAFEKVELRGGEYRDVELSVAVKDLAYWDETTSSWQIERGEYNLFVGNSSEAVTKLPIIIQ